MAYEIGLHPAEFERLQPGEFYKMLDGYKARRKDEDMRRSYFVAMLMNPHLKEPIDPKDIFKPLYYSQEEIDRQKQADVQNDLEYFKSFASIK